VSVFCHEGGRSRFLEENTSSSMSKLSCATYVLTRVALTVRLTAVQGTGTRHLHRRGVVSWRKEAGDGTV
jgi:hypothetical protein